MKRRPNRLVRAIVPLLAAALAAVSTAVRADDLVVGSWGGVWDDTVKAAIGKEFTAETGAGVQTVQGLSVDQFAKLLASPASPPFDVLYIDLDAAAAGFAKGMFQKLDVKDIPNLAKVYPQAIYGNGQAVAASFGSISIVYNSTKIPSIDSWQVFADPKYKEQYVLPSLDEWGMYMLPLLAKVYGKDGADTDTAFQHLKGIAAGAQSMSSNNSIVQLFATGAIDFAPMYSGSAFVMFNAGQKNIRLAKPKEGMVAVPNLLVIPANAKHPELAEKFINIALGNDAQVAFAKTYASSPSVQGVQLDPALDQWLAGAQEVKDMIQPDWVTLSKGKDAFVQAWNTQIVPVVGTE